MRWVEFGTDEQDTHYFEKDEQVYLKDSEVYLKGAERCLCKDHRLRVTLVILFIWTAVPRPMPPDSALVS